ncbi:MAG TPA: efflux RND transporter periplasmic adaptor subunit [Candidatus Deferrimicrobiaceae bacterium]|nr:efflux RND transporter periplasmic adaptor subunit [Candidatus Deferrimicrobiaceae bacterium]
MKRSILTQILLVLVAAGLGGAGTWYWVTRGMHAPAEKERKEAAPEEKQYTCPMHPFIVTDKPGACPICGMALVPVKSSAEAAGEGKGADAGAEGTIRVDPNTIQSIGVRTELVREGELRKTIRAVGRVTYDERRIATVNAKIGGWIERLHVNTTGEPVRKGQPLIDLYSPDLVSAQQEYLIARKHFEQVKDSPFPDVVSTAREMVDSSRKRLSYWDIGDGQIAELERTGEVRKTLTLSSPFHGVVVQKAAFDGTRVMPGMELFRIADLSRVWVNADIYEYELPWVKEGIPATVTLDYLPGKTFRGTVSYVYPFLEEKTRTASVRVELSNPGGILKPDMYAHVELHPQVGGKTILVPSEAVIRTGVRNVVFVARGEGRFEPREVTLGLEGEEGTIQVLSGLKADEHVVVSAQFLLDSESSIREALKKFQSAADDHRGH